MKTIDFDVELDKMYDLSHSINDLKELIRENEQIQEYLDLPCKAGFQFTTTIKENYNLLSRIIVILQNHTNDNQVNILLEIMKNNRELIEKIRNTIRVKIKAGL